MLDKLKKEEEKWGLLFFTLVFGLLVGMCIMAFILDGKRKNKENTEENETVIEQEVLEETGKEEKKEEKIGLSIGNIGNIENFNVENVIIKEKGRNINIDTITETE